MEKRLVKIGEAANLLGCSVSTLRKWEASGELIPARKTAGGTRYYAVADLLGLGDTAGSKSLTATPTQFYQHLQKLAGDATLTYGKTPIEALRDRDRKRDAALLRECISPNNTMLQAHLEELARLRESGKWEPTL